MKNKQIVIGIIAVIALILVYAVVAKYANFQRSNVSNPAEASLKEVVCDVLISNPIGIPLVKNGDLVIENVNCQQQYVNTCGRFGLFSDKGSLRLDSEGGLGSAVDVKVGEHSSQSYSLSWCGSKLSSLFKVKLFNDNNENIQVKEVTLR